MLAEELHTICTYLNSRDSGLQSNKNRISFPRPSEFSPSLRDLRGQLFKIRAIEPGSILIGGAIVGTFAVTTYVLQNTVGETLKEAWLESDAHKELKRVLKSTLGSRRTRAKRHIDRNRFLDKHALQFLEKLSKKHKNQVVMQSKAPDVPDALGSATAAILERREIQRQRTLEDPTQGI